MIKKLSTVLALVLILAMTLSLFAGCNTGKEGSEDESKNEATTNNGEVSPDKGSDTESKTEVETEALPEVEKNNYGKEFFLWIVSDSNVADYHWIKESKGDIMTEAVYNRQEQVRQYLGVEIVGQVAGGGSQTMLEPFRTAVKNKDDSVQMLVTHVFGGIAGLVSSGYLTDYNDLPGVNIDAEYWDTQVMEDMSVVGKMFLGKSRFNNLYTYVIAYNKDMLAKYADSLNGTVYDMVNNYTWTLDQMIALSGLAYVDATADGKSMDDTFGISGDYNIGTMGMLHSSNINLVEQDEKGNYTVAVYNEINAPKTVAVVEKLRALMVSDGGYMHNEYNTPGMNVALHTGRVLMTIEATNSLEKLATYDMTFGVLPYPLYDEAQKDVGYRHLQWGGYLAIPSYLADAQMTGETAEMLSYYSTAVNEAYYDKLLGKQASDMPEDRAVLNLVWDTICSDFGQAYCELGGGRNILYLVPNLLESSKGVASYVASNERAYNTAIAKFIKIISKSK